MPRPFATLATFIALSMLGACVTPQSVTPPSIALEDVRLLEARGLMQMVRVDLMVSNPNDFDIPLTGLDFSITVNGRDFAQGLSNAAVTLPRHGRATVPVEVAISMLAVLQQLQAVQKRGSLDYHLSGTAFLDHVLLPKIDFERAGSLGLRIDGGGRRLEVLES